MSRAITAFFWIAIIALGVFLYVATQKPQGQTAVAHVRPQQKGSKHAQGAPKVDYAAQQRAAAQKRAEAVRVAAAATAARLAQQRAQNDANHDKRQQIVDDYGKLAQVHQLIKDVDAAANEANSGNTADAYGAFDSCASQANDLMTSLPDSLPDYIEGHDSDSATAFTPAKLAYEVKSTCEAGRTYVNDPTPEHENAFRQTGLHAGMYFGGTYVMYEHAYVAAGGHASDFPDQELNGGGAGT